VLFVFLCFFVLFFFAESLLSSSSFSFILEWQYVVESAKRRPPGFQSTSKIVDFPLRSSDIPARIPGFKLSEEEAANMKLFWPAGESEAAARLQSFFKERMMGYGIFKDFPANEKITSLLSPYIALGVISPRTWYSKKPDF
jgi:deoxyribodipyrimidine photolyase